MRGSWTAKVCAMGCLVGLWVACDDESGGGSGGDGGGGNNGEPLPPFEGGGPTAGNPEGDCSVPAEAQAEDVSDPTTVIGDGTPESCTGEAFVDAVAKGGVITFDCGPDPVTIELDETARVYNDQDPDVVIDGGGLVTLSGRGQRRILYMNTCDQSLEWTTSHCDNQDHPRLTLQNLTFVDGDSSSEPGKGGGAVYASGGRTKVVNCRFFRNRCDETGDDVGGGAIATFQQYDRLPVYVVNSTFGGEDDLGNSCSSGGAVKSIGVSWTVINSLFSHNQATGTRDAGGGMGGAIANDGREMTLSLCGTQVEDNVASLGGGAIFFTSNDETGHVLIDRSVLRDNTSGEFESKGTPGIFWIAAEPPRVTDSVLE